MPSLFGASFKITKDKDFQNALIKIIDYMYSHPEHITEVIKSFVSRLVEHIKESPSDFLDTINDSIAKLSNSPADELIDMLLTLVLNVGTKTMLKGPYKMICDMSKTLSKKLDVLIDNIGNVIENNILFLVNKINNSYKSSINQIGANRDSDNEYDELIEAIFTELSKHDKLQDYNLIIGFFMYNSLYVVYTHLLKKYPTILSNIINSIIDTPRE